MGGIAEIGQADGEGPQQASGAFGIIDGLVHRAEFVGTKDPHGGGRRGALRGQGRVGVNPSHPTSGCAFGCLQPVPVHVESIEILVHRGHDPAERASCVSEEDPICAEQHELCVCSDTRGSVLVQVVVGDPAQAVAFDDRGL